MKKFFIVSFFILFLNACAGDIKNSGSIVYEENIMALQSEKSSNKEDVLKLIGPPSYRSTYNTDIWYYMHERTSQLAFFKRKLEERNIYILTFKDNTLASIDYIDKTEGNKVDFERKRTKIVSPKRTLLEKVFTGTQYGI